MKTHVNSFCLMACVLLGPAQIEVAFVVEAVRCLTWPSYLAAVIWGAATGALLILAWNAEDP